jgi:uncharacterized protein (TIGR03067 family)
VSLIWEIKSDGTIVTTLPNIRSTGVARYVINSAKEPKEIDLYFGSSGPKAKIPLRGIYVIRNDVLTVCYPNGYDNALAPRPSSFDVIKQSDTHQILRLKRVGGPTGELATRPGPADNYAVVFAALSDSYITIDGRNVAARRDPEALARLMRAGSPGLAALAKDAAKLAALRVKAKALTDHWRSTALMPNDVRKEITKRFVDALVLPDTPENRKNFLDDVLVALQIAEVSNARIHGQAEVLLQMKKVQAETLLPVLRERFAKAKPNGGTVTMTAKLEKKLPAELSLTNTGPNPLHNVVVWFHIEMLPQPGSSARDLKALGAAYLLGTHRALLAKMKSRQLQDAVTAMGSRNIAFIPVLQPGATARITYELGSIRRSKQARFSLASDELRLQDQEIAGVRKMQQEIEKRFGPGR